MAATVAAAMAEADWAAAAVVAEGLVVAGSVAAVMAEAGWAVVVGSGAADAAV